MTRRNRQNRRQRQFTVAGIVWTETRRERELTSAIGTIRRQRVWGRHWGWFINGNVGAGCFETANEAAHYVARHREQRRAYERYQARMEQAAIDEANEDLRGW